MYACGHEALTKGCGGCGPGAIEAVILDPTPTDHDPIHPMTAIFGCIAGAGFILLGAHYGLPL